MSSALTRSRLSPSSPAIHLKFWICVVLAGAPVSPAAARTKLAGKVLDAAAFNRVRTYCVDTSNIKEPVNPEDFPQPEAFDVREMIKTESEPKGLLSKLPWKLEADCSAPGVDAIVRFDFRFQGGFQGVAPVRGQDSQPTPPPPPQDRWRAEMQVSGRASSRVIYKAEGTPVDYRLERTVNNRWDLYHAQRQRAAYYAMAALISDLKAISKNP